MKKLSPLFYNILVFTLAQLAWFFLLGLWIYWYVSNYILFNKAANALTPLISSGSKNVFALVSGLILLVVISVGMSLIFIYLNKQLNLTKMYDNFIANVSHELKSPLSSIQLYLETMKTREVPASKQKEFFSLMIEDVERLNNLINSILYISGTEQRKTAYKYPHDYHVYDAESIIRELIDEAAAQFKIPEDNLKIEGNAPCKCVIDRNWLKIVFDNLFDNAIKYSEDAGYLKIYMYHTPKFIVIEFSDRGIGISAKDQKKIFNKFERIYNQNSPNVKGTGLGLYWVKEIIKYHGGKVSVFSAGTDRGSTFKIELPIYQTSKKKYINTLLKITKKSEKLSETNNEQEHV
jgi:signal transduction histidine kinase